MGTYALGITQSGSCDRQHVGISLVTAYRGGFAARIRDSGVDGLIRALAEKNREGLSVPRTAVAGG